MKKETIKALKDLRMGEDFPIYKPSGDVEIEIFETLSKLKNLGVLKLESKTRYKTYLVNDSKLLSKFIELKDFEKLVEYIENTNEPENGIKSSLEYKILKHLKDNENGRPISLDNFHKNENLLRSKISELVKLKYITKVAELSLGTDFSVKSLRCEIRIDGIKYLNEIESENKSITNNGIYIEANDNKGTQSFEKIEVKKNNTKHKTYPNKNHSIWQMIKSFAVKFWWQILIPLIIGVVLILIQKGEIDIGI
jgi:hypothetical protein